MNNLNTIKRLPELPGRPGDAHKGTFGTVIVVGGSETMIGAPALCARAAFRAGAGLVKIAMAQELLPYALMVEPGATGVVLDDGKDGWHLAIQRVDPGARAVLAVGPGMGLAAGGEHKLMSLLSSNRPVVLDADGLTHLAGTGRPRPRCDADLVLTPHPGEFERLAEPLGIRESPTDPTTRPDAAAKLAHAHHGTVLLKGQYTVVSDGTRLYVNKTGNPALATAGSGDILTGLIAALMGQGMVGFDAAVLATHLHGLAADLWAERHGLRGMRAQDLADAIPDACNQPSGRV